MKLGAWPYWIGIGVVALVFAWLNRAETMALNLGIFTWYQAPVAPVILGSFVLGMAAMVLVGVMHGRSAPPDRTF